MKHGKLVATKAREEGSLANTVAQPLSHDPEIGIAYRMALCFIERLEVIEVDHEESEAFIACTRRFLGDFELTHERGAVGKISQGVILGDVGDTRFSIARASDVGTDAAPAAIGGGLSAQGPPHVTRAYRDPQRLAAERRAVLQKLLQVVHRFWREKGKEAAAIQVMMRKSGCINETL